MEAQYNPIPEYIREITEVSLTKWGQIKLTGFPEAAIVDARKGVRLSKNAKNPFALLFKIAEEYCKKNGLSINWPKVDFLKKTYNMPENAPMMLAIQDTKAIGKKSIEKTDSVLAELAGRIAEASKEDPFTAALNVERHYAFTEAGKKFVHHCGPINPWLGLLTNQDQERILEMINTERLSCTNPSSS